jgi:DNA-binding HxlR family transcriptional regulator
MSFKYNNAVQKLKPLSGHAVRLILWYLADHASDEGIAYASYETLMRACQIKSRTTVNLGLQELEGLGIFRRVHRPNQCVKYMLDMMGIKLHMIPEVCLAPGCLNKSFIRKNGITLCKECAELGSTVYDTQGVR